MLARARKKCATFKFFVTMHASIISRYLARARRFETCVKAIVFLLPSSSHLAFWEILAARWYVVTCMNFYALDWQRSGHGRSFSWFCETRICERSRCLYIATTFNRIPLSSSSLLEHTPYVASCLPNFSRLSLYFNRKLTKCLRANDVYT